MSVLILVFCLIGSDCRGDNRREMPVDEMAGGRCAVSIEAQTMAAEWAEEHPKWTFKGWLCETPRPPERGA